MGHLQTMKLLIASNNAHKQQELREIMAAVGAPAELVTPRDLGIDIDPAKVGKTIGEITAHASNSIAKVYGSFDELWEKVDALRL